MRVCHTLFVELRFARALFCERTKRACGVAGSAPSAGAADDAVGGKLIRVGEFYYKKRHAIPLCAPETRDAAAGH